MRLYLSDLIIFLLTYSIWNFLIFQKLIFLFVHIIELCFLRKISILGALISRRLMNNCWHFSTVILFHNLVCFCIFETIKAFVINTLQILYIRAFIQTCGAILLRCHCMLNNFTHFSTWIGLITVVCKMMLIDFWF